MKNVSGIVKKASALLLLASLAATPALALAAENGGDIKIDDNNVDRIRVEVRDDRVRIELRADDLASLMHSLDDQSGGGHMFMQ